MTPDTHERSEFNLDTASLDTATDAQLNELFAVEVAGWTCGDVSGDRVYYSPGITNREQWPFGVSVKKWTADANAVLPWLEKMFARFTWHRPEDGAQGLFMGAEKLTGICDYVTSVEAPTFPRAAVIALIRAKRAAK